MVGAPAHRRAGYERGTEGRLIVVDAQALRWHHPLVEDDPLDRRGYRASAHVDVEHDRGDREAGVRLRMPVTVLQQDWGPELSSGAAAMWGAWATDLDHRTVSSGHFMAEEAPGEVIGAVRDLLAR